MKVKIIETPKRFEPVTIQVTIEKEGDLQLLYHKLNQSIANLKKGYHPEERAIIPIDGYTGELFLVIGDVARDRGVKMFEDC